MSLNTGNLALSSQASACGVISNIIFAYVNTSQQEKCRFDNVYVLISIFFSWVARGKASNFVCFENEIPVERSLQCQPLSFLTLLSQSSSACSMSGLAHYCNQKRQRMCKPCQRVVLVLHNGLCSHNVSWIRRKQRDAGDIFPLQLGSVGEVRFKSFARNINPRHYLRTTHWAFTIYVLNISWQSNKSGQFITGAHLLLQLLLKDPETEGSNRSLIKLLPVSSQAFGNEVEFAAVGAYCQMEDSAQPLTFATKLCISRKGKATGLLGFALSSLA